METRIYVGNLSEETTEEELRGLFSQAGKVASVMLKKGQDSGQSTGDAIIEMSDQTGADKAIEMFNGEILGDRPIKVILAWHRKAYSSSGYSRGGAYGYSRPGGGYGPGRPGEGTGSHRPRRTHPGSSGKDGN